MSSRIHAFLRDSNLRAQLTVAVLRVAAPIGLVVALLLAGAPAEQGTPLVAAPVPGAAQLR